LGQVTVKLAEDALTIYLNLPATADAAIRCIHPFRYQSRGVIVPACKSADVCIG